MTNRNKKTLNKLKLLMIGLVAFIVLGLNGVFYYLEKESLQKEIDNKARYIGNHIIDSIQTVSSLQHDLNTYSTHELRTTAINIHDSLPEKIKYIENEDLIDLTKKLLIDEINILQIKDENIEIIKSNNEANIGTIFDKNEPVYKDLIQFHERKQYLYFADDETDSFGTFNVLLDNGNLVKTGYYFDQNTDYIINTYINDSLNYNSPVSFIMDGIIDESLERYYAIEEISVINTDVLFDKTKQEENAWGFEEFRNNLLVYGEYNYHSAEDKTYIEKVMKSEESAEMLRMKIKGKDIISFYVPLKIENQQNMAIIIRLDSEYFAISQKQTIEKFISISILSFVFFVILLWVFLQIIFRKEKTIVKIQNLYSKHIESLFDSVKGIRHDTRHHLFTIRGLLNSKEYDELEKYVNSLVKVENSVDNIIETNNPILSGLLQAKSLEANQLEIDFVYRFEGFSSLDLDIMKVSDLVRIIGNILDNAFYAVKENNHANPQVIIRGNYQNNKITIKIHNNGLPIPEKKRSQIFENGFTTKHKQKGDGIGLYHSKKILDRYKGTIAFNSEEDWTTFIITMPVKTKEVIRQKKSPIN